MSRVPAPSSQARTIVVKRGDTLSSIAKQVYGSESLWPRILRANRAQLGDADDDRAWHASGTAREETHGRAGD